MQFLNLPNELLLLISKELDEPWDLYDLLRVNRQLALLLAPVLWELACKSSHTSVCALYWAVASKNEPLARFILQNGDVTVYDPEFSSMLCPHIIHLGPQKCSDEVVALVMSQGVNLVLKSPDEMYAPRGFPALHWAVVAKHRALITFLLDTGDIEFTDYEGVGVLHRAVCYGDQSIVRLLLEKGVDVNILDEGGVACLQQAVWRRDEGLVRLLLEKGAVPDCGTSLPGGGTQLHLAAHIGSGTIVEILLENGADIEAKDVFGRTPFLMAIHSEKEESARLLQQRGADIFVTDAGGWTPLHYVARNFNEPLALLMLEGGIDINSQDIVGYTPLHVAASLGNEEMVRLLLEKGALMDIKDINGFVPIDLAAGSDMWGLRCVPLDGIPGWNRTSGCLSGSY